VPEDAKRDATPADEQQGPADEERASAAAPETPDDVSADQADDDSTAASTEAAADDADQAAAEAAEPDAEPDEEPEEPEEPEETGQAEEPEVIEAVGELIEETPAAEQAAEQAEEARRDVEAELARAHQEAARHLDDLRRLAADFENYRKRVLREQTARAQSASQALVTRLLPVLDHFELAMTALAAGDGKGAGDLDKMRKGVEMVLTELRDVLRSEGLEPIEAEGKPFDPQRHEAVASVEAGDDEPGTVVGVVRTGYELHGRVIRPAMVRVAQ
jgi:molecular chaperone GrpE